MHEIVPFLSLDDCAQQTIRYLTQGKIAISGGTTYAKIFPLWASLQPNCANSSFFPVDERVVPFDDPHSNWGQAYQLLLKPIGKEDDRYNFANSAEEYQKCLQFAFNNAEPIFDTIFLGVGTDGHTASLFPGNAYLEDMQPFVLHTKSPLPPPDRISLAPRVLIAARKLIVIIEGSQKKHIVDAIRDNREDLPIVKILSRRAASTLFVERSLLD